MSFGDDLLAELERRDFVEDIGDRQRGVADVGQLARWAQVVLLVGVGVVARLPADRVHELLARGEVSVHGAASEARLHGDGADAGVFVLGQRSASRVDDLRAVQCRVAALTTFLCLLADSIGAFVSLTKRNTLTHLCLLWRINRIFGNILRHFVPIMGYGERSG